MVRFLHTADWQLGKQFANIADGDAAAALRDARFETVAGLARAARDRGADAVLVAGDVFETNAVADVTLRRMLAQLRDFPGPWVLIPGNHDAAEAESVWTRLRRMGLPDNVILPETPEPVTLADGKLAVLPALLQRRHEPDDTTEWFDGAATPNDAVRVGLAHGTVLNRLPESAEVHNPIADDRAASAGLDYLALGDWHGTLEIAERSWYAGTPEPDRFRWNDPGNALWVGIEGPGALPKVEKCPTGKFEWVVMDYAVGSRDDVTALSRGLEELGEPSERRLIWLTVSGVVDFAVREALAEMVESWRARLRHLRLRDDDLLAEPSADDLDRIDRGGFVRTAIETLRQRAADPQDADRETARDALLRLYLEHVRQGG